MTNEMPRYDTDDDDVIEADVDNAKTTTDDLDIGDKNWVASGEVIAPIQYHSSLFSESTTSNSYTAASVPFYRLQWDNHFGAGVVTTGIISGRVDPSTDQIDIRLRNTTDGETIVERTGLTSVTNFEAVSSATYTPTTTDSVIEIKIQIRNSDNSTSVTYVDAAYSVVPQL